MSKTDFQRCAELISSATGLLVTAGAGMGVDSGLPDFRGDKGLWNHYPALGKQKMGFADIACPATFDENPKLAWGFYGHRQANFGFSSKVAGQAISDENPKLAWGFYGHRMRLYRETIPHQGFEILREIGGKMPDGMFVFTSNVDGQFQKAGFDPYKICEVHGSIHFMQCMVNCIDDIWKADDFQLKTDDENCLLLSPMPRCPGCGGIARPNILMFNDWNWNDRRMVRQQQGLDDWLEKGERLVGIELGAGAAIPSARMMGARMKAPTIR